MRRYCADAAAAFQIDELCKWYCSLIAVTSDEAGVMEQASVCHFGMGLRVATLATLVGFLNSSALPPRAQQLVNYILTDYRSRSFGAVSGCIWKSHARRPAQLFVGCASLRTLLEMEVSWTTSVAAFPWHAIRVS